MKNLAKCFAFTFCLFSLIGCIDEYEPKLTSDKNTIVIDAVLTDKVDLNYVKVFKAMAYNDNEYIIDNTVTGAEVWVIDNKGERIDLEEKFISTYLFPRNFAGKIGSIYTLYVKIADGRTFVSEPEQLVKPPEIKKFTPVFSYDKNKIVYDRYHYKLFVDVQDDVKEKNFFKWNWRHYDVITTCHIYSIFNNILQTVLWYEEKCCEKVCFKRKTCKNCINLATDEFRNGKIIAQQLVGEIPFDGINPYHIIIDQYSLTEKAYKYWNSLKAQTNNVGGIFDATPARIVSNITNKDNKNDVALGFFQVSGVSQFSGYINRQRSKEKPVVRSLDNVGFIQRPCENCEEKEDHTLRLPPGFENLGIN